MERPEYTSAMIAVVMGLEEIKRPGHQPLKIDLDSEETHSTYQNKAKSTAAQRRT